MSNPWALEVHDFDQVHLVPGRRESRVLPNLGLTVEEVATGAVPAHELVGATVGPAPGRGGSGRDRSESHSFGQGPAGSMATPEPRQMGIGPALHRYHRLEPAGDIRGRRTERHQRPLSEREGMRIRSRHRRKGSEHSPVINYV